MEIKINPEGGLHVPGLKSIEVHNVDDVNRVRNKHFAITIYDVMKM